MSVGGVGGGMGIFTTLGVAPLGMGDLGRCVETS